MPNQPNTNLMVNEARPRIGRVVFGLWYSAAANMGNSYGNHPNTTVNGVFTVPDGVSGDIIFKLLGLSAETVGVTLSADGTNYSSAIIPVVATTGLDAAAATLSDGLYVLPLLRFGSPKFIKFTKSSTSSLAVITAMVPSAVESYSGL